MRILAFDQSVKRTGWAVVEREREGLPARPITWGSFGAPGIDTRAKMSAFICEVGVLVTAHEPDVVVWESPSAFMGKGGVNARTLILTRLDEALTRLCEARDLACTTVAASSWRSRILGKGCGRLPRIEAKRRAMMYVDWLDLTVANDDEAEAICIGMWGALFSRAVAA
jgi:Holliday junction resolvasome RuvABC endonuclease subunit